MAVSDCPESGLINLLPFFEAPLATQIHVVAALGAAILGSVVLWRRKGGRLHKFNGRFWVALMAVTAASSFFIHEIKLWGNYSPIHLLSVWVLFISLPLAIFYVRRGNIERHKQTMQATFVGGIVLAGGFTFLPGRMMHEIVFGDADFAMPSGGWMISIAAALVIAGYFWVTDRRAGEGGV